MPLDITVHEHHVTIRDRGLETTLTFFEVAQINSAILRHYPNGYLGLKQAPIEIKKEEVSESESNRKEKDLEILKNQGKSLKTILSEKIQEQKRLEALQQTNDNLEN